MEPLSKYLCYTLPMNSTSLLSDKNIPVEDRLIFALDYPSTEEARTIVKTLGDSVTFYKVGLELFMTGGGFDLVKWLTDRGKKVFVDLKFFDVPQTVQSAVRALSKHGATFATIHGNDSIMAAATKDKGEMKVLAVTMLTSLDEGDVRDLGFQVDVKDIVLSRAKRALQLGCDGVISSGLEVAELREHLGDKFIVVTPGIRPVKNTDDQKRTVDVEEAFHNGADYIVVGRPIKEHANPKQAAEDIQERIKKVLRNT